MELHRVQGVLEVSVISQKTIVFLGLGSLGSLAAGNLAYPWKKIILVDPEILEVDNVERHLLGRSEIGKPKVEGVARWLIDRGIDPATIEVHAGKAEEVLSQIALPDLLIVNIDKRAVNDDINTWCVKNNVPALYGGIYPNGTGGQIMIIPTPQNACYQCAQFVMGGSREAPAEHIDYGIDPSTLVSSSGDLHGVSALRWTINALASDMTDLALEVLTGESVEPQILIHAHEWEPLLILRPGAVLNTVSAFIGAHEELGLVSNAHLRPWGKNRFAYEAKRAIITLRLSQWSACSEHLSQIAADTI